MRDGLHALVTAMPQVDAVHGADDLGTAFAMALEHAPALVVVEYNSASREVWTATRRVKARWPAARCIFLVEDVDQRQEAEAAGADVVLLQGFPAGRLVAAVVRLLPQPVA
jgi:DNA-binding NarL/FixJ family response regulator